MTADLRPTGDADREWMARWVTEQWGDVIVVSRGKVHQPDKLPGFAACRGDEPVGLATYRIDGDQCEIVTLDSRAEGQGIGTALINAVVDVALREGVRRLWLITTNDNTPALRFYENRGFRVVAVHRGAIDESRRLKPSIPLTGIGGVEIRDEIELEIILSA
jgi:GNAT superfamily N-acetyltransferase